MRIIDAALSQSGRWRVSHRSRTRCNGGCRPMRSQSKWYRHQSASPRASANHRRHAAAALTTPACHRKNHRACEDPKSATFRPCERFSMLPCTQDDIFRNRVFVCDWRVRPAEEEISRHPARLSACVTVAWHRARIDSRACDSTPDPPYRACHRQYARIEPAAVLSCSKPFLIKLLKFLRSRIS